ncbi:MAG: hypothetical protein R3F49_19225 [Planctomycetota bacterium]
MQRSTHLMLLAGGVLACGLALGPTLSSASAAVQERAQQPGPQPPQRPADPALNTKIQDLERRLASLEAWVEAQQEQAKLTAAVLAEAEAAGFTAGINPKSRELLLGAWREAAAKAAESGAKAGDQSGKPPRRGK